MATTTTATKDKQKQLPWDCMDPTVRSSVEWWFWTVTWILLIAGYFDRRRGWYPVVAFSVFHALFFWFYLFGGLSLTPFPVQLRIAYVVWVVCGTFIPGAQVLIFESLLGLTANVIFGYCPLARLISLMPWNRSENLSFEVLRRTFLTPPQSGQFQLKQKR